MDWATAFVLAGARAMGVVAAPGWPDAEVVPPIVRGGLGVACGLILAPVAAAERGEAAGSLAALAGAVAANLVVGLLLGFGVGLVWSAAEMAGTIGELAVGLNPQAIFGAAAQAGSAPLVRVYALMLALLFFGGGGLEAWVGALGRSFDILPACCGLPGPPGPGQAARIVERMLGVAVALAAPVLLSLLVVNLTLAVSGRLTAQAALYFAALPAEAAAATLALVITLGVTVGLESRLVSGLGGLMDALLRSVGR
jgi:flagellar biosynthesis protein FliR